ncbi:MAG: hypothetical protein KIH64_008290, partial [Mycobacterium sp.]|nr:hypothetical protein [Mycobacterium sp.]
MSQRVEDAVNDVDRWFDRAARRSSQPVSLYPSLLTGRLWNYLRYRLRYPLLIATVRFAVHVAEFFILLSALGGVAAFTVMVLRAGSLLISGGWWGLLEVLRERLRGFADAGDRDASDYEIGRWIALSALLAVLTIAAGALVFVLWNPSGSGTVARVYAFLIVVEFAIDLPVRVLHSGVYATRRVYKPPWSMLVPIAAQLAILGFGFYLYPSAAIVVAIVVSNAIGIWITLHFTLEVYRLMGLQPRFGRPWWRDLPSIPLGLGVATTVSGLSLRIDALLVLAMVGFYGTSTRTFDLTAGLTSWARIDAFQFFYLILPLFRGTYESAGLFYFDLVRLRRAPALRELQLAFFRRLLWAAPAVGLYFWALSAALGVLVMRDVPMSFLLALIPLFLLRSLIGVYQMRLFAEGRFGVHVATLGLLAAMMWLVWLNPNPAGDLVEITAAMIVQLIVLINHQHFHDRRDLPLPALLQFGEWTRVRARETGPTATGTVRIPQSTTARQKSAIVTMMRETFDGRGYFTYQSPTALLYYERFADGRAGGDGPPAHIALLERTGAAARPLSL